ncbi:MAG: hypothetical protein RLZZ502_351 [Pseudomonadota bacterium]|jgi:methylglutaconyl-CoA hydratase
MHFTQLQVEREARGVVTVVLNRADLHNAFSEILIAELTACFSQLGHDPSCRVIILRAEGKSFSAGADLNWMRRAAAQSETQNQAEAMNLANMLHSIAACPKPTIARVQGNAFAGGIGLVSACDMAIAVEAANFCLSEVKLGIIPATISPYVIEAIGPRQARRYFLTAEKFSAAEALRIGLIHAVCADEHAMDASMTALLTHLLNNGPQAIAASKELIAHVSHAANTPALRTETARRIAQVRATPEGREGVSAFLEKRSPSWVHRLEEKQ